MKPRDFKHRFDQLTNTVRLTLLRLLREREALFTRTIGFDSESSIVEESSAYVLTITLRFNKRGGSNEKV
jgi:hypothetical protein